MDIKKLHELEQAMSEATDHLPLITGLLFEYQRNLVEAGFTDEQALYLVAIHGTTFGVKGDDYE